jgi:hypothetical protein
MKSPTVQRIRAGNDEEWIRQHTPEKIHFDLDGLMEEHDTPTFNSHHSESFKENFPFLENKQNENDENKASHAENTGPRLVNEVKTINVGERESTPQLNSRIKRVRTHNDFKSKGSTSPESNGLPRPDQSAVNGAGLRGTESSGVHFSISKIKPNKSDENIAHFGEMNNTSDLSAKKRTSKVIRKKSNPLQKKASTTSDKSEKG